MKNSNNTMRALIYKSYGKPTDVLTLETDVPIPIPAKNELLIRVESAAINPVDWKLIGGFAAGLPLPSGILPRATAETPHGVGLDVAGTIAAIGDDLTGYKIGDEVYGNGPAFTGTMAEYCIVPASLVTKKPRDVSMAQAASLPSAALTSYQALFDHGGLSATDSTGKRVLILGGSGGTGSLGIQLAKAAGVSYVATTCSGRNAEFVSALGADLVIDYTKQDFKDVLLGGEPFDVVYDCVGGHASWVDAQSLLTPGVGCYVTIVGDIEYEALGVSAIVAMAYQTISRRIGSFFGRCSKYSAFLLSPKQEELEQVSRWLTDGKLKPLIQKEYPLSEFQEAFKQSMSHRTRGKLVLNINEPLK